MEVANVMGAGGYRKGDIVPYEKIYPVRDSTYRSEDWGWNINGFVAGYYKGIIYSWSSDLYIEGRLEDCTKISRIDPRCPLDDSNSGYSLAGTDFTIDRLGNIVRVSCYYKSGSNTYYIQKLSPNGDVLQGGQFSLPINVSSMRVCCGEADSCYVFTAQSSNYLIAKIALNGVVLWTQKFAGQTIRKGVDSNGNSYLMTGNSGQTGAIYGCNGTLVKNLDFQLYAMCEFQNLIYTSGAYGSQKHITCIDKKGNTIWKKLFSIEDAGLTSAPICVNKLGSIITFGARLRSNGTVVATNAYERAVNIVGERCCVSDTGIVYVSTTNRSYVIQRVDGPISGYQILEG